MKASLAPGDLDEKRGQLLQMTEDRGEKELEEWVCLNYGKQG